MATFLLLSSALGIAGCGSSSSQHARIGPIVFTNANGMPGTAPVALAVGSGVYMDALVNSDTAQLGVNWSVTCSSELPPGTPLPPGQPVDESCGFFTPVHTASAPVPTFATSGAGIVTFFQGPTAKPKAGTITLYASSTSNPANFTSVTVNIVP